MQNKLDESKWQLIQTKSDKGIIVWKSIKWRLIKRENVKILSQRVKLSQN